MTNNDIIIHFSQEGKAMNKRFVKRLLVFFTVLCMTMAMTVPAFAAGSGTNATTDDPANGILQVMLAYVDDGGNRTYFSAGTCFMVNEEYVVTNKHVFDLDTTDSDGVTLRDTIVETMGLKSLKTNDTHLKLYVFANRDTNVEATVDANAQSEELDFAALKLSRKISGRQSLVLGDSDSIKPQDTVFALGYPADSIQNKQSNTKEDVSITNGIISKVTVTDNVDIIEHTASLNNGNSGGPLLNADNEVIGINEFIIGQKGYSIQINQIKELLDTYEIAYTDGATGVSTSTSNSNDAEETEEPDASTEEETTGEAEAEEEKATEPDADLVTALQSEITKAKKIDQKNYTEESAKVLDDTIGSAETVAANKKATNDQVTTATNDLKTAIDNLEEKSGPNMIMIAGIAAAVVVVIIVIVVIIVVSNGKKKKAAPAHNNMQRPNTPPTRPQPAPQQQPQYSPVDQGDSGTTLLNSGSGETTLLNGGGGSAYLIRRKNGEKIMITSQNFAIGKERRRVNYCVSDNTSVSRYHAIITKKGSDYYVADQKSSNFTYVNGVQLSPYQETLLTDRSTLKLSDEEFEFHLS